LINTDDLLYKYSAHSRAHLDRAKKLLEKFDNEDDVSSFFYAALELRFGIEARLYTYIEATYDLMGLDKNGIKDYVATKLLRRLISVDTDACKPVVLKVTEEQTGESVMLNYTPVTPKLAKMHGHLGEILHFKFFRNNSRWYFKGELRDSSQKTLLTYRRFLEDIINELDQATRGTLLCIPKFTQLVQDILEEN
jgi:hypothetical protein